MPSGPTSSDPRQSGTDDLMQSGSEKARSDADEARREAGQDRSATEEAREHLESELRAARSVAIRTGADPGAVTADLAQRLRRIRLMLAEDEGSPGPGGG